MDGDKKTMVYGRVAPGAEREAKGTLPQTKTPAEAGVLVKRSERVLSDDDDG